MSQATVHEFRRERRICQRCRERKARFQYRGTVKADRHHTLCFECFRSERERQRARRLVDMPAPAFVSSPLGHTTPSDRQVAHRRTMLMHLEQSRVNG